MIFDEVKSIYLRVIFHRTSWWWVRNKKRNFIPSRVSLTSVFAWRGKPILSLMGTNRLSLNVKTLKSWQKLNGVSEKPLTNGHFFGPNLSPEGIGFVSVSEVEHTIVTRRPFWLPFDSYLFLSNHFWIKDTFLYSFLSLPSRVEFFFWIMSMGGHGIIFRSHKAWIWIRRVDSKWRTNVIVKSLWL